MDSYVCTTPDHCALDFDPNFQPLEAAPVEGGIGFYSWTIIGQRHQGMALQPNRAKIARKRFPIDVDLPTRRIRQLTGVVQLREPPFPDVQEVLEGDGKSIGGLDMDHASAVVRMKPVEARAVGRNTDLRGDGRGFPVNVYGQVGMNVNVEMFITIARCAIYSRIGGIGRCLALPTLCNNEIDEYSYSQHYCRDDANGRNALRASGTPALLFTTLLFLFASFLS